MSKTIDIGLMGNQHINKVEEEQEMTKNEQIKKWLEDNREELLKADASTLEKKNGICFDGIVDEEQFYKQNEKIMFLLREPNGNDKKGQAPKEHKDWNYQHWLQYQQAGNTEDETSTDTKFYSSTFNKLCMWVDVFYNCLDNKELSFDEYKKASYNETNFREVLKKTAIINLKKTWGKGSTEQEDLNRYVENKTVVDVIQKEIAYIEPDVVICGSEQVYNLAKGILKGNENNCKLESGEEFTYFKSGEVIYLNFYHPACRKSRKSMYDFAVSRFNAIKGIL